MNRLAIEDYLGHLEELSKRDYSNFEIALILFLRSDSFNLKNYITDSELLELKNMLEETSSILDLEKEDIDNIIYHYEEEEV